MSTWEFFYGKVRGTFVRPKQGMYVPNMVLECGINLRSFVNYGMLVWGCTDSPTAHR